MSTDNDNISRVDQLIAKGDATLRTHRPNPPNVIGFPTLDSGAFSAWQTQSLAFLHSLFGNVHPYVDHFKTKVTKGFRSSTQAGIGILQSVREDLANGNIPGAAAVPIDPLPQIEEICSRFHLVARQLRSRHENRETLSVADEYDVQDLLHSLLWLFFDDVRPEESTPSYAGKASRMDFLLKNEQIVIEVKKTHAGLGAKQISSQLIEDIDRYKVHPDCRLLVCFVYDLEGLVANPRGIENDLNRDDGPMPVSVLIRPA